MNLMCRAEAAVEAEVEAEVILPTIHTTRIILTLLQFPARRHQAWYQPHLRRILARLE
jgi:hypothetical protein